MHERMEEALPLQYWADHSASEDRILNKKTTLNQTR